MLHSQTHTILERVRRAVERIRRLLRGDAPIVILQEEIRALAEHGYALDPETAAAREADTWRRRHAARYGLCGMAGCPNTVADPEAPIDAEASRYCQPCLDLSGEQDAAQPLTAEDVALFDEIDAATAAIAAARLPLIVTVTCPVPVERGALIAWIAAFLDEADWTQGAEATVTNDEATAVLTLKAKP